VRPGEPETEFLPPLGATVIRKSIPARNELNLQAVARAFSPVDPFWLRPISTFLQEYRIDVLHVHDSPLLPTALRASKRLSVPVVADLHENMPAAKLAYRQKYPPFKRAMHWMAYNYSLMRRIEARSLRQCIRTVVVVPEAAERVCEYGIPARCVVLVSNTEDETTFDCDPDKADNEVFACLEKRWRASYIGAMGPHRGVDTALRAVPRVLHEIPDFQFLIVGAGDADRSWIRRESTRLGVEQAVKVVGWQPFSKVKSYILASDVCLVPHKDFEHTQTTIPHKLFQCMICGKPLLVSDCRPLARVVSQGECGSVFKANSSKSLAEQLLWMHRHPEELDRMGRNGRTAALGPFSWRHDATRLVNMYQEIAHAHAAQALPKEYA
jgi:glycosyltransferase involved in cell wall biosynthesis